MISFTDDEGSLLFAVRVVARASKTEIVGVVEGSLKVRVSAPPVDGAANKEVINLLANAFGVARSDVSIVNGETSRIKRVRVVGARPEWLLQLAGD